MLINKQEGTDIFIKFLLTRKLNMLIDHYYSHEIVIFLNFNFHKSVSTVRGLNVTLTKGVYCYILPSFLFTCKISKTFKASEKENEKNLFKTGVSTVCKRIFRGSRGALLT